MNYTIASVAPIILLPFFAFVVNTFIVKRFTNLAVKISCGAIIISFLFALRIFNDFLTTYSADYYIHKVFNWFDVSFGELIFKVDMGIYIDNMSAVMLLMVTGVASLIHVFSTYYMKDDPRYGRFFVYLSLFTSAMLGLVLSDNLLGVFIFWELMGFCSYSLIGFYYEKEGAGNASLKAFMTTRVGDVFFLLGILAIWSVVGNVNYVDIYAAIESGRLNGVYALGIPLASFAGFCIFMGTIGKSAQVPLQVWLPDAMWGPTPCSALIHAATMVAAGVYLSLRAWPILELGELNVFIAYVGAITAFLAATIALIQSDIKAVLAYSTISQLGYMVLGIGVGAWNPAFMHLITHAVFKACLFLGAGSVIHSLHDHHTHAHVQEMPRMGGLRKKMPFTFMAMLCCTFAIAGFPFFSGFVSKDRILGDALIAAFDNPIYSPVAILGFVAAFLTSFYMFRMMFLTFFGSPRDADLYKHTHQETFSLNRNLPLIILAVFTLGFWYCGSLTGQRKIKLASDRIEWFQTLIKKPNMERISNYKQQSQVFSFSDEGGIEQWEKTAFDPDHGLTKEQAHHVHDVHHLGAFVSIIIAVAGFFLAFFIYFMRFIKPSIFVKTLFPWNRALENKYGFDYFYIRIIIQKMLLPFNALLASFDMKIFDRFVIDGTSVVNRVCARISKRFDDLIIDSSLVDGTGVGIRFFNMALRILQSGKIQFYFLIIILVLTSYILSI
ncbi:MAG: NADH-quinone oxidoreductase subunit L [Halobacteriovoraceae bacterium]|nr:NADH-quinone oxidoreductase subunit L [Halobacteriovoraceae bacterium]